MSGVPQLKIQESAEELRTLMKKQKTSLAFAKLQTLYLFKIQAAETVRHIAVLVGRGESIINRILEKTSQDIVRSLTGWDFILEALSLSGI